MSGPRTTQYSYIHVERSRVRPSTYVNSHSRFTFEEMVRNILRLPTRADRTFSSTRVEV